MMVAAPMATYADVRYSFHHFFFYLSLYSKCIKLSVQYIKYIKLKHIPSVKMSHLRFSFVKNEPDKHENEPK
jgi:hypothetical protein